MNIRFAFIMKDKSAAVPKVLTWCRQQGIKLKMDHFNGRNYTYCLLQPLRYSRSAKNYNIQIIVREIRAELL